MNPINRELVYSLSQKVVRVTNTIVTAESLSLEFHFWVRVWTNDDIPDTLRNAYFAIRNIIYVPRERLQRMLK